MVRTQSCEREPIVRMVNITKDFGGVYAVNNVDMDLYEGEMLVGDNAAGKSTLIKTLSGAYIADEGQIYVRGKKVRIESPKDAMRLGIETIYQDLALVDNLKVPENIFVGREIRAKGLLGSLGIINMGMMKKKASELLSNFSIEIQNVNEVVEKLSGGQRQMVAISRAVYFNAQVIIMDEPTASLGVVETEKVYDFIRILRDKGISVIIISHNINEVFNLADRFMVLKTGSLVGIKQKGETDIDEIVAMIISGKCS
jgi:ABC-type sugar transport system ATPase subunit